MNAALITGATSGIGKAFAWRLAKSGHDLVLVARRKALLQEVADTITQQTGVHVQILPADLSTEQGIADVCHHLDSSYNPCSVLVHAAGFALGSTFTDNAEEKELSGLHVMVEATLRLNYHAARSMRKRHHGAIINLSSMASRMDAGTYCAHKAWVRSFSIALADELRTDNVRVLAVTPGPVKTAFFDYAGRHASAMPAFFWVDEQQVVDAALRALATNRTQVTPGILQSLTMTAMKIAPSIVTRTLCNTSEIPHL